MDTYIHILHVKHICLNHAVEKIELPRSILVCSQSNQKHNLVVSFPSRHHSASVQFQSAKSPLAFTVGS